MRETIHYLKFARIFGYRRTYALYRAVSLLGHQPYNPKPDDFGNDIDRDRETVYRLFNLPDNWTYTDNALRALIVTFSHLPIIKLNEAALFLYDLHYWPELILDNEEAWQAYLAKHASDVSTPTAERLASPTTLDAPRALRIPGRE